MFEEAGSCGFVEAESGEKRNEAKVGQFSRLLEAVHRLVDSKDDAGLAGGVELDKGEEVKARENLRRELVSKYFDELGGVEVKIRQVYRAKESVV